MDQGSIREYEISLKAEFGKAGGENIPETYGDTESEAVKARAEKSFSDISNRGKLRISGKDHLKLLNGMLTNDILNIESGKGILACILTNKGKIITDMRAFRDEDSVYLDLEPGMNAKVAEHLLKFRLSYKAEIEDITESYGLIHIFGPGTDEFVKTSFGIENAELDEYDHVNRNGHKIIKINRTGETGYDILFNTGNEEQILDIISSGFAPVGSRALEILRIEAGIPRFGKDMDDNTIPIEAGLWNALNFEKGCYVGQEVVARIKWRGRVNRHLLNFEVEGSEVPAEKDGIYSGDKQIGKITSAARSQALGRIIALGYIRREHKDNGTEAELLLQNGSKTTVRVSEKPFINNFV